MTLSTLLVAGAPISQASLNELGKLSLKSYFVQDNSQLDLGVVQRFWQTLVETVHNSSVTDKYLTTTCNVVAVFLLQASSSLNQNIREFGLSEKVWCDGLDCAQVAFRQAKTKPALQIIETLTELVSKQSNDVQAARLMESACFPLVKTVVLGQPKPRIKEACTTLSCFVRKVKRIEYSAATFEACFQQVSQQWTKRLARHNVNANDVNHNHPCSAQFILALLFSIETLETRSSALKLLGHICHHGIETLDGPSARKLCAETIELYLRNNEDSLNEFADNIFPLILDNREQYETFVHLYSSRRDMRESQTILFLAVLRVGRLKNFLAESDLLNTVQGTTKQDGSTSNHSQTPRLMDQLLKSANADIRIKAYNLLTTSPTVNTPVPANFLRLILDTIRYLHDDNDAHQRGEVLSITRRFLKRLEASATHFQRSTGHEIDNGEVGHISESYFSFARGLVAFLGNELSPALSYQRHIMALLTFQLVLGLCSKQANNVVAVHTSRALVNLILDPYDDVRGLATNVCQELTFSKLVNMGQIVTADLAQGVALLSAATNRGDHADAAGRFWTIAMVERHTKAVPDQDHSTLRASNGWMQLVDGLERNLGKCRELKPGLPIPLHGSLLSLVHFVDNKMLPYQQFHEEDANDLIAICQKIWVLVQPSLCVDSPETSSEDADDDVAGGPKDLLAYSWRALRDSSLVLQAVIRAIPADEAILRLVGSLCMEQLTKLRHRGAFSTVSQTFNLCCEQARGSNVRSIQALNRCWYQLALVEIGRQSTKLTRRSAGLPAMFTALLDANDAGFFSEAISTLVEVAQEAPQTANVEGSAATLPQVHAMNSLKDVMTTSKFRAVSEKHIAELVELATNSMASSIWAIRNCGLMLLKACMTRLDQSSQQSVLSSTKTSPAALESTQPIDVATAMLQSTSNSPILYEIEQSIETPNGTVPSPQNSDVSENTFAALELLSHLYTAEYESEALFQLVEKQLYSRVWAVRDHAARLLAKVSSFQQMSQTVHNTMVANSHSNNHQHGVLLYCRYYLRDHWQRVLVEEDFDLLRNLFELLEQQLSETLFSFMAAAVMDIFNDTCSLYLDDSKVYASLRCLLGSEPKLYAFEDEQQSYMISSRCALNMFYQMLMLSLDNDRASVVISKYLLERLTHCPDDAKYVVEQLFAVNDPQLVSPAICFSIDLLSKHLPVDVETLCIRSVSNLLSHQNGSLSEQQTSKLQAIIQNGQICGRELRNDRLPLQAHLLASRLTLSSELYSSGLMIDLIAWLMGVRDASTDELEYSTRLRAIEATAICGLQIMQSQLLETDQEGAQIQLQLLSIIYDQLNDDDEDIREAATILAMNITNTTAVSAYDRLRLGPLAAREVLQGIMFDRYRDRTAFAILTLARVVGNLNVIEGGDITTAAVTFHTPVASTLTLIADRLEDLFAEEKQNLYIDEIDEVERWSSMLSRCSLERFPTGLITGAFYWVSQGLQQLAQLQEQQSTFDFQSPLGLTYQPDILVLFLRLIHLATALSCICCHKDKRTQKMFAHLVQNRELLTKIRASCKATNAHPKVVQALDEALSTGQN